MINFVSVLVGDKWPDVWAYRMSRMLKEKATEAYKFTVITDRNLPDLNTIKPSRKLVPCRFNPTKDTGPELHMAATQPQGCWIKTDIFQYDWGGPVVCLDLDVVILGDPCELARDYLHMAYIENNVNGSIYSYDGLPRPYLYPEKIPWSSKWAGGRQRLGEQEWVAERYQEATGGKPGKLDRCYSFKHEFYNRSARQLHSQPQGDYLVVFFHGRPTPGDPQMLRMIPWVRESWYGLNPQDKTRK